MKGVILLIFTLFLLKHKVSYASVWTQRYAELNAYLQGFTLESAQVDTIFNCYKKCEDNMHCASINMNQVNKTCELKFSTMSRNPEKTVSQQNMVYMEIRDALGVSLHNPILSCKWFKSVDNLAKSGVYWMKFNYPSSTPFQVFCDMTFIGGGWTLVYSYTFNEYSNFEASTNAVTPMAKWRVDRSMGGWVSMSRKIPLSESSRSAMNFGDWRAIGNEFLLKPNITNWVACVEGTGSLVEWRTGSVTCRIVKVLTSTCTTVVPTDIKMDKAGPALTIGIQHYISLEGMKSANWPTHDPCGTGRPNHLTNVPYPGGVLYLR